MTNRPSVKEIALAMTTTKYSVWEQSISSLSQEELCKLVKRAEEISIKLAAVARYVELRGGLGYGDKGHEVAIQYAQHRKNAVRRALGYDSVSDD